jgi:hypothetical protein
MRCPYLVFYVERLDHIDVRRSTCMASGTSRRGCRNPVTRDRGIRCCERLKQQASTVTTITIVTRLW